MKKRKTTSRKRMKKLQKRTGERTGRQRELLQKTLDSIADAIFILDAPSPPSAPRILECNEAASSVFGYEKAEMLGRSTDFLHVSSESLRRFQSRLYAAVPQERMPFRLESRMRRKDGSVFPSEHAVTQLLNEKGDRTGWVSVVRDVSERKRAENALRESEEKYRQLFEKAMDGIALADPDTGVLLDCNQALATLVGRDRTELIGEHQTILHPAASDGSEFSPTFKLHTTTHEGQVLETQVVTRAGEIREVEIKASLLHFQGRRMLQGIFHDITERKRIEEKLKQSEDRFRGIAERSFDAILTVDLEGRITYASPALERMTGYRQDEVIGASFQKFLPESEISRGIRILTQAVGGEIAESVEANILKKDGSIACLEFHASPILKDGKLAGFQGIARDITERKRAEEALRRRAEELAALQSTVLDITGYADLSILLETIVERAARLLGAPAGGMYLCDPEKQEARCVVSYNTPHDYTGTVLKYGEGAAGIVAQTGEPLVIDDYRIWQGRATVFEEKRPFKAVLSVPMTWQGRVTGVLHVLDDSQSRRFTQADQDLLTLFANHAAIAAENTRLLEQEKHHAEELARYSTNLEQLIVERTGKLAESERRFRELSDMLPQIVFEIDENGNVQYMNRAGFAATGLSKEEFGKGDLNAFHFLAPSEHDRATRGIQRVMTGEMIGEREFTVLRGDGTSFPALVYTAPITHQGKSVGLRGIAIDITQRKRAEEELRSARERLEHVITSNPAVIITGKPRVDLSDYDVTYISDRVVEMLGFEPRQFIGHPEFWDERVHPDDLGRYLTEVPELWKKGRCTFEYRFLHKDGTYRWIREEANVIRDATGNAVEIIGYWTDITEQKQMQEALLKSQRLATIGETAAVVGHDLRNPLEAIAGATYLLKRQAAGGTIDDRARESLRIIEKSIEYSDKIINDLLEYSAEVRLRTSTTDPRSVTDTALSLARIPENVRLVNETQAEPKMVMDADKMGRAFLNIIRNAVEAMPQGGTLTISSRRTNDMVEFRFEDTGVGMSKETLEKLWTPLFTTKARGMGFGLAITRRIVEAHGGTVAANGEPGRGSSFTLKLPVKAETREVSSS